MWTAYDYFDLNEVEYTHERWFVHSNILYFGCFGNVIYKIEKLTLYIGPKWISPSKASTLLPLIASIVKFSIVHDWFSALLFVTSSVRDHVGVQLRVLSNLFFVIWYLCDSYVNYGEGGGRGEWKDFPWCSAFNYIITIRSSRDLSFRHGRCQDDLAVWATFPSLEADICSLHRSRNPEIHDSHGFSLLRDMLCAWTLRFSKRVGCPPSMLCSLEWPL